MQHDDAANILAGAEFFDICSDEERHMLAFASERKRFPAGTVISRTGEVPEGLFILISGTISLTPDGKGEPNPHVVSETGTLIGTLAMIIAKPRPVTITAVTIVEILVVPRKAFVKLANQSPQLAERAAERVRADLVGYLDALEPARPRLERE